MKGLYLFNFFYLVFTLGFSVALQAQCPSPEERVAVVFRGDENYLLDNSRWEVLAADGQVLVSGREDSVFCLPATQCYTLTVYDDFGDGLGGDRPGFFSLSYADEEIAAAIDYGFSVSASFGDCTAGSSCFAPLDVASGNIYRVEGGEQWYIFRPTESGYYEWSTCELGNTCNTTIWVYDRCLGLTGRDDVEETLLFSDTGCETEADQAYLSAVLQAGLTYYFRIGGVADNCVGSDFRWQFDFLGPVTGCTDPASCNYDPLATSEDGSCLYEGDPNCPAGPDLIVAPGVLLNSLRADIVTESGCYINEGCLQGYGPREVVRFTTHIKNIGSEDYVIGQRDGRNGQFEFDECHGHWHYEGYAEYRLYDATGRALPAGFKNGFCVIDLECSGGGTRTYGCGYMGISAGCGDIYSSGLDCQWVDVTDLPDGQYTMAMLVNWDRDPDLFGRNETNYDNNIDVACFSIDRSSGSLAVTRLGGWGCFTDCGGAPTGDNQYDCFGVCGGDALHGDLNGNGLYEIGDVDQYLNGILDATIPVSSCTELTSNNIVDIEDVAWLMDCILVENNGDDHQSHAHSCELPTIGVFNPYQWVGFAIMGQDQDARYVDVGISCADVNLVATHLELAGLEIERVESLLPTNSYNAAIRFRPDGQVLTLSYDFTAIPRQAGYQPFLRVYYSAQTAEDICLTAVRQVVNRRLETLTAEISSYSCTSNSDNCFNEPEEDSDGDGVCDALDRCPGGDDGLDMDEDGIPDFCDDCPLSPTGDTDGDGVCDNEDICPDGSDNLDQDDDGVPDGCDSCPLSASDDSDGDTICDNLDQCLGSDDRIDTDGDGVPDGCDVCPGQEDVDVDADGICDDVDICLEGDDNLDADGDGTPDACDECPLSATGDTDGDGVCDNVDVCQGGDDAQYTVQLQLEILFDRFPRETSWELRDASGELLWSGGGFTEQSVMRTFIYTGMGGNYQFTFRDSANDGLCCGYGEGYFVLTNAATGEVILEAAEFGNSIGQAFVLTGGEFPDMDNDGVCDPADQCPGFDDLADADSDGIPDGCDDCPNSATGDSDGDSICDDADQCPGFDDLADADSDGIPDGCDDCPSSATGDSDGDSICDDADQCPGFDDLADADSDGLPDGCDDCPSSATGDSDGDSICDDADQCPGFDDLADADSDGLPDGCDDCPNSATGDSDGDSICDDVDQCPGHDDMVDLDADGIPDGCDDVVNGIDEIGSASGIVELYPNPTTELLNLHLHTRASGQLIVFDVYGQQWQGVRLESVWSYQLNVAGLPAGAYYLIWLDTQAQERSIRRFVKLR